MYTNHSFDEIHKAININRDFLLLKDNFFFFVHNLFDLTL